MHVADTPYFVSKLNNMKKLSLLFILSVLSLTIKAQVNDTLKTTTLKQVVISGNQPQITVKTDKVVMNVDKMTSAVGLNALELLRQAPGVTVDGQDNVKISGKTGIQVLVDGRMQTLNSEQLVSLLKSTNSANVKSLEIITNPSAKYDAAGNAGIINIVLKKSDQKGTSGSVSAGYQQMKNYRQNSALNLNYRDGKLLTYLNANFDNSLQNTTVASNRVVPNTSFVQNGIEKQGYSNPGLRTGAEFNINEQHKIGALFNFQRIWDDFPSTATTLISNNNTNDILSTNTTANLTENRVAFNLNYQYTSKNKTTLTVDADQLNYTSNLNNSVVNTFKNSANGTNFSNATNTQIGLSSIKADLNFNFKNISVETGAKFSASKTDNILNALQNNNQGVTVNQFNDFNYNENTYASYLSLSKSFGKWSVQTGLRAEMTAMSGTSVAALAQKRLLDTTYLNLFPSTFLRYAFNQKQSIGFAYNRRITRPSFQDQNPYQYRTDFYYASEGNPSLLPQFTQSLTVDYTFNGQTQLKLNYNSTTNLIETISTQLNDQTLTMPVNAGTRSFINISISSPAKLTKFWNIYYTAEPYYQFYKADLSKYNGLTKINNGGFGFNAYISNNFSLSKTLKASLSSWFNYASRSSIYATKPISSVDLSLRKQLLENKLSLSFAYRDIFNTQRWQQNIAIGNVNQTSLRKWESSGAYVSVNYNFGNGKIKSAKEKSKTDEQLRIKQRN
jgi:iron complex outermembrane receptor protein